LIVEIGPGKGALTEHLLPLTDRLIAIEIDVDLVAYLNGRFGKEDKLQIVHADAREIDFSQWGRATIAGNLPYYVATPIISRVVRSEYECAVFLIQKEVAERVTALPGSKAYGYFSVETRLFAEPELLFTVPAAAFHPPPKVDSAVIRLTPRARAAELGIENVEEFLRFASLCFQHKRKTLRNNLLGRYGSERLKAVPEVSMRAEQLSIERLAALFQVLER
jgi:16S rRNA (adenine1518-N6/adenine1519-N6)-dimethyltransferase